MSLVRLNHRLPVGFLMLVSFLAPSYYSCCSSFVAHAVANDNSNGHEQYNENTIETPDDDAQDYKQRDKKESSAYLTYDDLQQALAEWEEGFARQQRAERIIFTSSLTADQMLLKSSLGQTMDQLEALVLQLEDVSDKMQQVRQHRRRLDDAKPLKKTLRKLKKQLGSFETNVQEEIATLEQDVEGLAKEIDNNDGGGGGEEYHCGCKDCDDAMWSKEAPANAGPDFTCGSRIQYKMREGKGLSELDACRFIASMETGEHRNECGPACDPDNCGRGGSGGGGGGGGGGGSDERTPEPTLSPHTPPLSPESPLYCFPPYNNRLRKKKVFAGKYIVEVKEDPNGGICGPGNNKFTRNTVEITKKDITLKFKKVGDQWEGSEVRIIMKASQMPYSYGTFKFSVKSVAVQDVKTGERVSDALPPDLVLGLFTWDSTEKYDVHENWNHECDIELSRWGNATNSDAQFLVQPPEQPHYYRFFSGRDGTMDQGGHVYEFTWNPTSVSWYTDAGGPDGTTFRYTTQQAIEDDLPDRNRCLPADMEVRINLWSIKNMEKPAEMEDTHEAVVVIDDFSYNPSNELGVSDGEYCSKHCQCLGDSLCVNSKCKAVSG